MFKRCQRELDFLTGIKKSVSFSLYSKQEKIGYPLLNANSFFSNLGLFVLLFNRNAKRTKEKSIQLVMFIVGNQVLICAQVDFEEIFKVIRNRSFYVAGFLITNCNCSLATKFKVFHN